MLLFSIGFPISFSPLANKKRLIEPQVPAETNGCISLFSLSPSAAGALY
jgi:hypothetical protein